MYRRNTLRILVISILFNSIPHAHPLQDDLEDLAAGANGQLGVCLLADTESVPVYAFGEGRLSLYRAL
jgi:hypothetical protein